MLFENNTDNVQNGYRSMIWPSVCKCVFECVHLHIKKTNSNRNISCICIHPTYSTKKLFYLFKLLYKGLFDGIYCLVSTH